MEAVPLNIARIRKLLGVMPEAMRQRLTAAPREQVRGQAVHVVVGARAASLLFRLGFVAHLQPVAGSQMVDKHVCTAHCAEQGKETMDLARPGYVPSALCYAGGQPDEVRD
jgi:hypothetical protein